ncbi:MAG: CHAT domain-containing protein [Bacteroidales bacterium]|nr:CHAT domain-containing protein [Bacteroidales bacterium]
MKIINMRFTSIFFVVMFLFVLKISSQTDKEDYNKAVNFFNQANEAKQKFDLTNSEQFFEKAAELFKKYGHYTGNYIQCKYSVADIFIMRNKFKDAEEILDEIQKLSVEKYGQNNQFLVNILNGQGKVEASKGKHKDAVLLYLKSLELNEELEKPNLFLKSNLYGNIGNSYSELGKLDSALLNYKKDLTIKKELVGDNHPILEVAYSNIANIYKAKGQYDLAIQFFDKALELILKAYGKNDVRIAKIYSGKGNVYLEKGQNNLALDFFNESIKINKSNFGQKHISVAKDLIGMGNVYNKKQEYEKALIYFKDAYDIQIDVLGENHPDIAGVCNNIGFILEFQNKHESSLKFYQKAVKIKTANFGNNHPELATYYNNIGVNYYNRKEYNKALENYLKAIAILENNYGNKFAGLVRMYLNVADLYRKKEKFDKSLLFYQKSLTANVPGFNPNHDNLFENPRIDYYLDINKLLNSLEGKAGVLEALYLKDSLISDLEFSKETYILCDSVISVARKQAFKESDKIFLGNQTRKIYEDVIVVFKQLADETEKEKDKQKIYESMFSFAEKNKSIILSQAISSSDVKNFAGISKDIISKEKELKREISTAERSLAESADVITADKFRDILFELNKDLRELNARIERDYPKYFRTKYKSVDINVKEIKSNLKKDQIVRSYFLGEDFILIFTITDEKISLSSVDKPEDFEQKVKDFNKYITSGYQADFSNYLESANYFYNLFFPDKFPEDLTKITVIPDGLISMIPFEALITEEYKGDITNYKEYPFLIKKYQINYAYSAGLLIKSLTNKKKRGNKKAWIGIAPVFDNVSAMSINNIKVTPLPGSKNEITEIAGIFKKNKKQALSVIEKQATETFLKNANLKDYKYIHIATHGIVNTYEPKLSGLIFYPEDADNDGVLYSGEIYNLELDADLTVLSACETGLGKISKSEGIIGLSRALLYAGSDNTIVSLWKVSDNSTSTLMIDFYKNLLENEDDKTGALHAAKIDMINNGGDFAHPFFWSPFVLIGK